ncbi:tyrosine-protein phosphatase [Nocardiaceae bacterium NPDC056970]
MSSNTRSTARLVTALATTLAVAGGVTLAAANSAAADPVGELTGSLEALPPGLLTTIGSVGSLIPVTPNEPTEPGTPSEPILPSVENFRDMAGPGYSSPHGTGRFIRGFFYRSGDFSTLSPADKAEMNNLGVYTLYDLRTPAEVSAAPDIVPNATDRVPIPISVGDLTGIADTLATPEQARAYMQDMYRKFVTDAGATAGFGQLLNDTASKRSVVHCTNGKDRTGWAAALIQSIAGVSRATIEQDYLLSDDYLESGIEAQLAQITAEKGAQAAAVAEQLLRADPSYIDAAFDAVDQHYGSIDNYLRNGLQLTEQNQDLIRWNATD